jgi:hydroxymethylbilane synthase
MNQSALVLGTRGSTLALRQANLVRERLEALGLSIRIRVIRTKGDRVLDVPLSEIEDKGLFTAELDLALLDGTIQLAVHSLKDLPTRLSEGIVLAAVPKREDPRDAFVAHAAFTGGLSDVPEGGTLATASLRRRSQLKAWRPDLRVVPVRGNVDTRVKKLDAGTWSGIVLAAAGLKRLGMERRITELLDPDVMLSAVGQGALAVVCAEEDTATRAFLRETIHDPPSFNAVIAERAFLHRLQGGCTVPVGARAIDDARGTLELDGCVADPDGTVVVRGRIDGRTEDGERLGIDLAEELLARGADEILDAIRQKTP